MVVCNLKRQHQEATAHSDKEVQRYSTTLKQLDSIGFIFRKLPEKRLPLYRFWGEANPNQSESYTQLILRYVTTIC